MRCNDFRLEADERPAGAAVLSPVLMEHMDGCPACSRWENERTQWGELGSLFRDESETGTTADSFLLRTRVRAAIARSEPRRSFWTSPAFGTLAASLVIVVLFLGPLRDSIDVTGDYSDQDIQAALVQIGLADFIAGSARPSGQSPQVNAPSGSSEAWMAS